VWSARSRDACHYPTPLVERNVFHLTTKHAHTSSVATVLFGKPAPPSTGVKHRSARGGGEQRSRTALPGVRHDRPAAAETGATWISGLVGFSAFLRYHDVRGVPGKLSAHPDSARRIRVIGWHNGAPWV